MLLVFDNIEHFMSDAGLLVEILERTPAAKHLVTSREALNLRGEWVFEDARDQRLALFLNFAEEAERKLRDAEQLIWRGRLEQEHDNLRAALDWSAGEQEDRNQDDHAAAQSYLDESLSIFSTWAT